MRPVFIGISGKIASGKTTIANMLGDRLCDEGECEILSYARMLKLEADRLVTCLQGVSKEEAAERIEALFPDTTSEQRERVVEIMYDGEDRPVVTSAFYRTNKTRELLQYWGTDVRRAQDPDYWVKSLLFFADHNLNHGVSVIVDDVRFPNEADAIFRYGGRVVRINVDDSLREKRLHGRDGGLALLASGHASETSLDEYGRFSYVHNIHKEESTEDTVDAIVKALNLAT